LDPIFERSYPELMIDADRELLEAAQELLARTYVEGRHEVAAALRTADGRVHVGVHVDASARRPSVCAEGAALGAARAAGGQAVEAIVAVQYKPAGVFRVIAPCGSCRELISDHAPDARVYVWDDGDVRAVAAIDLLPYKTRRAW
jgi:cytidine deaminase